MELVETPARCFAPPLKVTVGGDVCIEMLGGGVE